MKKTKPKLEPDRVRFLKQKTKEAFEQRPYLRPLRKHLLRIGGFAVVLWNGTNGETITVRLVQRGEARSGRRSFLQLGEPSKCHENSERLHRQDPSRYEVRTGYALSRDGIWPPHSWVIDCNNDTIIETTKKRVTYFGVIELAMVPGNPSKSGNAAGMV